MIMANHVRRVLSYNKYTGIFKWICVSKYHNNLNNKEAGSLRNSRGRIYRKIGIDRKIYSAHRLAWLYVYGNFPKGIIDHSNGDSLDNRINNLKIVSHSMNTQNHKIKIKKNGLPTGVRITPNGKYVARISVNKVKNHIGTFDTKENAQKAYTEYRNTNHYCPSLKGK